MNEGEKAAYLREKAKQCFSMARYHEGEAAADLNALGRELLAKAQELEAESKGKQDSGEDG